MSSTTNKIWDTESEIGLKCIEKALEYQLFLIMSRSGMEIASDKKKKKNAS